MDEASIARLVLGYLREEGCRGTYKDFLKASRHLQNSKFSSGKFIPTRFVGLTLNDILKEYYEIYQTVQGRLEATNYYREIHCKTSLSHQLLYLLNNRGLSSRCSTPCFRSPADSHFDESRSILTDHVSDVETTPAHRLPGNIRCESDESDIPSSPRKRNRYYKSSDIHSSPTILDTEILAQTLLENKDLPEKIAQTINKIAEKKNRVSTELDETIQSVVKETAEDPIFDQILEEIIGSANVVDSAGSSETNITRDTHQQPDIDNNLKKVQKRIESKENCENPPGETTNTRVEEQNAEAIQSIIDRAKTSDTQTQPVIDNGKSDIIVFDGSLDKYLISNLSITTQVQQPQTPFVLNTNGSLLMVPSTIPTNIAAPTSGSQYYILNKPPLLNCYIPSPTVLTEKDILAMPTVIVSDDRPVNKTTKKSRGHVKIQPKPQIEISTNASLSEFLTLHKHQEENKNEIKSVSNRETNGNIYSNTPCKETKPEINLPLNNSNFSVESQLNLVTSNILVDDNKDAKPKIIDTSVATPPQLGNPKKSTPKSGSHVRNLNFSSPPKITSTHKKNMHARHSDRKSKKQAAKTLFRKDDNISNSSDNKLGDNQPWDAKLRAYVPKNEDSQTRSTRRRRTSKQKGKCHTNETEGMNTTEQDGALLEAALKTPIKTEANTVSQLGSNEKKSDHETRKSPLKLINKEISGQGTADIVDKKKKIKDMTNDGQNKTVLSPSKLNANKRNIMNNTVNENNDKFVTPEITHDVISYPIKANRNLTPMLETPVKENLPKTPGIETPTGFNTSSLSNFTPVTRMLEANLPGFNINLPTPNIPITPNFHPFTPTVDLMSPYANRPTDYSTSSSYYQPSDNEQNKSLEAQLHELEKKPLSDETKKDVNTNQHLNIFNKNVIGKKNLSLMKNNESECSSSSSDSSSSSSDTSESEHENSFLWTEKESNDTIIYKKKGQETPRKTYALRNRNGDGKVITPKLCNNKEVSLNSETHSVKITKQVKVKSGNKTPKKAPDKSANLGESFEEPINGTQVHPERLDNISTTKAVTSEASKGRITTSQESVLKELEEKKLRTINKFKNNENSQTVKPKKRNGKFIKIKPIPNLSNQRRRPRKSNSPKKNVHVKSDTNSLLNTLMKDLADSEGETDNISLRLSVSEDEGIQQHNDENVKKLEKIEKSASDLEAQTLIEGLRERGIHLMHNKNSTISSSYSKITQETEDNNLNDSTVAETATLLNSSENFEKKDDSGPAMNYSLRDDFDTCLLTDEICMTFDESTNSKRIVESYNINDAWKTLRARLYIAEINDEIDIAFRLTDFCVLLEINPVKIDEEKNKQISQELCEQRSSLPKIETLPLTDVVKQEKDEHSNESQSPSSRKRKHQDDEENAHKDKKCKTLLNQINVDSFLNNIHGNK